MKKFIALLLTMFLANGAARAELPWECGKTIEVLRESGTDILRPSLVYAIIVDPKTGEQRKKYKPLDAANEKVAEYLMAMTENASVCLKYYDPQLPPPTPLTILDIKND